MQQRSFKFLSLVYIHSFSPVAEATTNTPLVALTVTPLVAITKTPLEAVLALEYVLPSSPSLDNFLRVDFSSCR
jgi:hypothetical protein